MMVRASQVIHPSHPALAAASCDSLLLCGHLVVVFPTHASAECMCGVAHQWISLTKRISQLAAASAECERAETADCACC